MLAVQMGIVNLVMRSSDDDKTNAQVEARTGELLGTAAGSQRAKEEAQDPPAAVKEPVAAVAPPPVEHAESARHVDHAGYEGERGR